jgi:hypothetical protein
LTPFAPVLLKMALVFPEAPVYAVDAVPVVPAHGEIAVQPVGNVVVVPKFSDKYSHLPPALPHHHQQKKAERYTLKKKTTKGNGT